MLFTDDRFWNVSTDAKLLYGILLDRMNLSAKNGWLDENGRVYIIFTLEETMTALNCGDIWGAINLLEGYGNDNPGAKSQGMKQLMAGGGVALIGTTLVPLLSGLFG